MAAVSCVAREPVPETGRMRPVLQHSKEEMAILGAEAYAEILADATVITEGAQAELVREVGANIAAQTGEDYDWEFQLVDDPEQANAFCLPGGKVAVYSGILPITVDADGLAVVLGHEIAHATLQHANERLSEAGWKRLVGIPVGITANVWGTIAPRSRRAVMGAFGIGHVVGRLAPYSQEHEWEADEVGLRYMREAGYEVLAAPEFWERMHDANPGEEPSDALSTHPDSVKRAARLRQIIAESKPGSGSGL